MKRRCASCHGPVTHTYALHQDGARDGLGHWSCLNGCKKRHVSITRYVGAGKESEFRAGEEIGSKVPKDEYLHSLTVTRDIAVQTQL